MKEKLAERGFEIIEESIKLYHNKRVGHADGDTDWRRLIYTTVRFSVIVVHTRIVR